MCVWGILAYRPFFTRNNVQRAPSGNGGGTRCLTFEMEVNSFRPRTATVLLNGYLPNPTDRGWDAPAFESSRPRLALGIKGLDHQNVILRPSTRGHLHFRVTKPQPPVPPIPRGGGEGTGSLIRPWLKRSCCGFIESASVHANMRN